MGAVKLEGYTKLKRNLETLEKSTAKKIVRRGLVSGSKILVKATKDKAPVGKASNRIGRITKTGRIFRYKGGNLKKSISHRIRTKQGNQYAVVGPSWPKGAHGHLVEYGHGGAAPAPPHPFMAPAVTATSHQVANEFVLAGESELRKITG